LSILSNLGLENANFSIQFSECKPSGDGIDNINFLFSANPDQKLAPLSNVISGGEMSRFLLAIKSSISKKPNTFFLDEIDNGLSGKSLFSLVELIKEISKKQQVICITHQPFLAAAIDGASPFRKFVYVTFPLMAPISIGAIIIRLIEASKIMDTVFVLTSGGPGTATETSSFYIYIKGLREFQMGYAATLSFTYLVIMIISLTIIAKVLTKLMIKE